MPQALPGGGGEFDVLQAATAVGWTVIMTVFNEEVKTGLKAAKDKLVAHASSGSGGSDSSPEEHQPIAAAAAPAAAPVPLEAAEDAAQQPASVWAEAEAAAQQYSTALMQLRVLRATVGPATAEVQEAEAQLLKAAAAAARASAPLEAAEDAAQRAPACGEASMAAALQYGMAVLRLRVLEGAVAAAQVEVQEAKARLQATLAEWQASLDSGARTRCAADGLTVGSVEAEPLQAPFCLQLNKHAG